MALDIHYKLSLLSGWDFCFISRSAIFVTHNLAAWAVCCNTCGLSLYPLSLAGFLSMSEMGVALYSFVLIFLESFWASIDV